ncbi:MAG: T9SS type A sorting domain-containing protein, partial [Flavobacteriales bacterium]
IVIDSLAEGCLNDEACNYDPTVGINIDSLCILPDGCTDMMACNFNANATCDDGSCAYATSSSVDITADSLGLLAGVVFMDTVYYAVGSYLYISTNVQGCDSLITVNIYDSTLAGCTVINACNYNMFAVINDSLLCSFPGCMDLVACNYDANAICDNDVVCTYYGCTDPTACNYDAAASCDDNTCEQLDACGECGGNGVLGCTDMMACNFNPDATCDDGGCILPDGCTDMMACNFDPSATCNDPSSCEYFITVYDTIYGDSTGVVVGNDTLYVEGTVIDTIDVANGCDTIRVTTVGLNELLDVSNVLLYPNPSNTFFQLDLGKLESRRIEIFDISSRRIHDVSQIHRGVLTFDVNSYAPGYYFMRIYLDNRIIQQRFEVVR